VRRRIRRQWVSFVAFGVALIALGFIALDAIGFATPPSAFLVGGFLVLAGLMKTTEASRLRRWGGCTRLLLAGVLSLVVGLPMLMNPAASERSLTLVMATFFTIGGIARIAATPSSRFPGRPYALTSDVTVLLGIAIGTGGRCRARGRSDVPRDRPDLRRLVARVGRVVACEHAHRARRHLRLVRRTTVTAH
jgi:uncharacterized membrane protein HdeD (DUF308 family)